MEKETEVLEPYELQYSDLLSLSSPSSSSSSSSSSTSTSTSTMEIRRLEAVTSSVMEALGPTGPGLLTITGVPNMSELRKTLLPFARDLSLLPHHLRNRILKDHGIGSDVSLRNLDRRVSSYAMQLKYGQDLDFSKLSHVNSEGLDKPNPVDSNSDVDEYDKSRHDFFKDLGCSFRELGLCMMDLGLRVARVCDRAIGKKELEDSLLESGTAKGRLIHYHSSLDTCIIKESDRRKGSKKGKNESEPMIYHPKDEQKLCRSEQIHRDGDDRRACKRSSELWQQWHYDYGTFTVLTSPMFIRSKCCEIEKEEDDCANFSEFECLLSSGNTYLQIFHPTKNKIVSVKAPPECFILQTGESADILSRQRLRATLHSVSRPVQENFSRETFVVFLHPAWNKVFDISHYPMEQLTSNDQYKKHGEGSQGDEELKNLTQDIHKIIPPLSARLKDGMTFAEFSRETTKQYYGGSGLQSNR